MPSSEQISEILRLEKAASSFDGKRWMPGEALEDLKLLLLELLPEIKAELLTRVPVEPSPSREARRKTLEQSRAKAAQTATKTCCRCGKTKPGDAFYVRHAGNFARAATLHSWCIECCIEAAKQRVVEKRSVRLNLD